MKAPPQAIVEQILAIAPILPGQGQPGSSTSQHLNQKQPSAQAAPRNEVLETQPRYSVPVAQQLPSIAGNPLHPISDPKQPQTTLMDGGHHLNDGIARMSIQQPLQPMGATRIETTESRKPLKRSDTDTDDVDEFVDAKG